MLRIVIFWSLGCGDLRGTDQKVHDDYMILTWEKERLKHKFSYSLPVSGKLECIFS